MLVYYPTVSIYSTWTSENQVFDCSVLIYPHDFIGFNKNYSREQSQQYDTRCANDYYSKPPTPVLV